MRITSFNFLCNDYSGMGVRRRNYCTSQMYSMGTQKDTQRKDFNTIKQNYTHRDMKFLFLEAFQVQNG